MSISMLTWVATFMALTVMAFRRPVWGVSLYLFTFFINPMFWWWGDLLAPYRWNLFAGIVLFLALMVDRSRDEPRPQVSNTPGQVALLMCANALAVHLVLAANATVSWSFIVLLLKYVAFYFMMISAIRDRRDLRIVMLSFLVSASYIGYEVTINERGNFNDGRLEGVGAAGVQNSNELASLMLSVLPMGGYVLLTGNWKEKLLAAVATPLVMNVMILCNSRGAFLALIVAGITIVVLAPRAARGKVLKGALLGLVALIVLLGDPRILDRFMTTFAGNEERDASAATRQVIWAAALRQVADYPLGAGGGSFSTVYGARYLPEVGYDSQGRAVHNGFINEITNWGIQGLALRLLFFALAIVGALRAGRRATELGDVDRAILASCLISALFGHLVTSIFGDYLDDEWGVWLVALTVAQNAVANAAAKAPAPAARPAPTIVPPYQVPRPSRPRVS